MDTPAAPSGPDHGFAPTAGDDWDMSPRREAAVMVDLPTAFEPMARDRSIPTPRGLLSPAEIEALLRPKLDPPAPEAAPEPAPRVLADLASGPAAAGLGDAGKRLAARLSLALRSDCGVPVAATFTRAAQAPFDQAFAADTPDRGRAIVCFDNARGETAAMLALPGHLAQVMIETACGGRPGQPVARGLSPLDLALLEGLVRPLAASLPGGLMFQRIETDADFAGALAPPGLADIFDLELRGETLRAPARLVLLAGLAAEAAPVLTAPAPAGRPAPGTMTVILTARVASLTVPLSRLSALRPGATLLLGVPPDQPVELLSGGLAGPVAAEAQIGRKGNRIALRITRRSSL